MTIYNYNHLYYFYIAAKSGGVTNAAKHLHISQPSLSSQLKILEQTLDVKLFEKVGRKNQLSKSGNLVYGYCRQMFELSDKMGELICKGVPSSTKRIEIGICADVDRSFAVEMVNGFLMKLNCTQRPKVAIVHGTNENLMERLRFKEIDAMITDMSSRDDELENLEHFDVPVVLTCSSKQSPVVASRSTKIKDVLKESFGEEKVNWVMPSSHLKLRSETDHFIENNQINGQVVFESDDVSSLAPSVEDQIGFAFLPKLYIHRSIGDKRLKVIGDQKGYWNEPINFICHNQNKNDELIKSLAGSFRNICSSIDLKKGETQMHLPI